MLLKQFQHLLRPSASCLGCHPFIAIGLNTPLNYKQAPIFCLYEKGLPNNIINKRCAAPTIINVFQSRYYNHINKINGIIERENIWTIPNVLCVSRIIVSPYLGHLILSADFAQAFYIMVLAGITDLLDGFIARNCYNQASKLGSFLDPMADKILIVTLFATMTYSNLIPVVLTVLIIARDVSLIAAAFYIRYVSLPAPKTLSRYFDASHATAELAPTFISKLNTVIQLSTVSVTLTASVFNFTDHPLLPIMWYLTAGTTLASAASYIFSKNTYKIFNKHPLKKKEDFTRL